MLKVHKIIASSVLMLALGGCSSVKEAALKITSEKGYITSVSQDEVEIRLNNPTDDQEVVIHNNDDVLIVKDDSLIDPASLLAGESVLVTMVNEQISTIQVQTE